MPSRGLDKKYLKKVIIITTMVMAFFSCLYFFSVDVSAQTATNTVTEGVQTIEQPLGLPNTDIRVIIARIIKIALSLLGIIMVVLIMYGGFLWMTAGGNEEQIGKAKKVLLNAVIGLIIILSSYAIVLFVMRMLGVDVGGSGNGSKYGQNGMQHFSGSGALGRIIRDHYPSRDQIDVPRNTKIVISFSRPVLASSFIEDTNGNNFYGDCLTTGTFSWSNEKYCDRLKTGTDGSLSNDYINIIDGKTGKPITAAVGLASTSTINNVSGVYTIVIKPLTNLSSATGGYLGSDKEKIKYTVHLGNKMLLDDQPNNNPAVFGNSSLGNDYYEWQFTCSTQLDLTPPYVTSVFPVNNASTPKNTVIQILFNEAVDPTGLQGSYVDTGKGYYQLSNGHLYLNAENSKVPQGSYNLVNGYKTLEFTSTLECGKNACGRSIYCLPVCENSPDPTSCQEDLYKMLIKAGDTINTSTWEAIPFSGAMDISGNSLDGDHDNIIEKDNVPTNPFPYSTNPDNYYWRFKVNKTMDRTSPYLIRVVPGLDAEWVSSTQEWSMQFSKRMRIGSLYNIDIEEYPSPSGGIPMWKKPVVNFFEVVSQGKTLTYTKTEMSHGTYLNSTDYYPMITSEVEDVYYNCFYPGLGPNQLADQTSKLSPDCDPNNSDPAKRNCCVVTSTYGGNDFCCNGLSKSTGSGYDTNTCVSDLKKP